MRLTTFKWVPPFARGQVRDLRVRWALEEAGIPYAVRRIDFVERDQPGYRAEQPFGQVPVLEDGELTLFESGAIVCHIAARSDALFPPDDRGRARATAWVFAALNTVEVAVQRVAEIDFFHPDEPWAKAHRPAAWAAAERRLSELAAWLGPRPYLEGGFTAGDLMMVSVLRIVAHTDLVSSVATLAEYRERVEARPAFQRALRDHLAAFDPA